jgi:4-carboxymuconolactone decarboxylase
MARIDYLEPDQMNAAQRAARDEIIAGPRGRFGGPFALLVRNPDLCTHAQRMGAYLRFGGTLPDALREFCILTVARHYKAEYEWGAHATIGLEVGVPREMMEALIDGRRPAFPDAAFEAAYDYIQALLKGGAVNEGVYRQANDKLGEAWLFEVLGIAGFYSLISMTLNTFDSKSTHEGVPRLKD